MRPTLLSCRPLCRRSAPPVIRVPGRKTATLICSGTGSWLRLQLAPAVQARAGRASRCLHRTTRLEHLPAAADWHSPMWTRVRAACPCAHIPAPHDYNHAYANHNCWWEPKRRATYAHSANAVTAGLAYRHARRLVGLLILTICGSRCTAGGQPSQRGLGARGRVWCVEWVAGTHTRGIVAPS